jgi:hypothetical protein
MKSKNEWFTVRKNIDSIAAGAIGFGIIYLFTRHGGIGVSPDSVSYLSAARNLSSGHGLIEYDQMPLVDFPVFYSIFLSAIHFINGMDALQFAPILNGLLFGLLLYISGAMMNRFSSPSTWYKRILLSCFVLSPCLLEIYPMLWSETVFLIFVLIYIITLTHYFQTHELKALIIASSIAALACITRYAGVSLIGTGGLLIIFDFYLRPGKKLKHLLIFSLVSTSLLLINLFRNRLAMGFLTGERQKGVTPLFDNISYYGSVICDWLPLEKGNYTFSLVIGLLTMALFVGLIIGFILLRRYKHSYESVATSFGFAYSVFIIVSATVSRYQQLNSRLLCPLFIPFVWTISYWFVPIIEKIIPSRRIWIVMIGIFCAVGFQYNQWLADYETWDGVKDAGVPGYTEEPFPKSQIVGFIKKNIAQLTSGGSIYSNAADAVYFFTGLPAYLLPQKAFPKHIDRYYEEGAHWLIWFNDVDDPDEIGLKEILQHKKVTVIGQFPDGAVYRIENMPNKM